jgi:hypothetical protein
MLLPANTGRMCGSIGPEYISCVCARDPSVPTNGRTNVIGSLPLNGDIAPQPRGPGNNRRSLFGPGCGRHWQFERTKKFNWDLDEPFNRSIIASNSHKILASFK